MVNFQALREGMILGQVLPCTPVTEVLLTVLYAFAREECVASSWKNLAYCDRDIPLEHDRFLLSALSFVRLVMAAKIEPTHKVLDVGSGAGYTTALLSRLANHVVGLEAFETLTARARGFCADHHVHNVHLMTTPTPLAGFPAQGPYDVIVVEGALSAAPEVLFEQLSQAGRLVCFLEGAQGSVARGTLFQRYQGKISQTSLFECGAQKIIFQNTHEGIHEPAA
jgi:protein-L-isoaspartate(D-aspartate) O-methyltransferase